MLPIAAVPYTTADGVERQLRFTLGAQKRISMRLGVTNVQAAFAKHGDGALPTVAYCLMFDEKGRPPAGLPLEEFEESISPEEGVSLMAAVMSAASNGVASKNDLEVLLKKAQEEELKSLIGSAFGPLRGSASAFPPTSSGISPNASSTPSVSNTESKSDLETTVQA